MVRRILKKHSSPDLDVAQIGASHTQQASTAHEEMNDMLSSKESVTVLESPQFESIEDSDTQPETNGKSRTAPSRQNKKRRQSDTAFHRSSRTIIDAKIRSCTRIGRKPDKYSDYETSKVVKLPRKLGPKAKAGEDVALDTMVHAPSPATEEVLSSPPSPSHDQDTWQIPHDSQETSLIDFMLGQQNIVKDNEPDSTEMGGLQAGESKFLPGSDFDLGIKESAITVGDAEGGVSTSPFDNGVQEMQGAIKGLDEELTKITGQTSTLKLRLRSLGILLTLRLI